MKETVSTVFDDLEIGITLHDPETGAIVGVNSRLEALYGYSEAELLGMEVADYSASDEGFTQADAEARIEAAAAGEPQAFEWRIERADGRRIPVRARLARTELDGEAYVLAEIRDITDRKAHEADLERSNERLQEFAYILSHDLQEPLRMVSSYVDLLETELDEYLDAETREYMEFAVDGAERMRGMIDGLLQYSRVETEGESFTETDVEAVVDGVRQDLQFALDDADAELEVGELPTVPADGDQLGQLFQNLVSNAIEHASMSSRSETGDVHRSDAPVSQSGSGSDFDDAVDHVGAGTTIEISATEMPTGYRFAVSDDGPGIPADQQEDIFGLFDAGVDSDGAGIGLAVCERIVSRHDGELWVESTEGEGSTFYFTLNAA